jgi:hypothetical protein
MKQKIGWIDKMNEIEQMERLGMYVERCEDGLTTYITLMKYIKWECNY